jgi:RHS repeat-associated protein
VRAVYRPFGAAVRPQAGESAAVGEFGFTGQCYEAEPAVYDYGARWYDPALGRFLQPDPLVGDPFDPQSLNRYSYVGNDPGNRVDPTGAIETFTQVAVELDKTLDQVYSMVHSYGSPNGLSSPQPLSNYLPQGNSSILFSGGVGAAGSTISSSGGGVSMIKAGAGQQTAAVNQLNGQTTGGHAPVGGSAAKSKAQPAAPRTPGNDQYHSTLQKSRTTEGEAHIVSEPVAAQLIDHLREVPGEFTEILEVLALPGVVIGFGLSTAEVGLWVASGTALGAPLGAAAVLVGAGLVILGGFIVYRGVLILNDMYETDVWMDRFSRNSGGGTP